MTEGRERFEMMQVNQERSFLQAEVLYLQDEPEEASAEEIAQPVKLQGEIMELAGAIPPSVGSSTRHCFLFIWSALFRSISISIRPCWG